MKLHPRPRFTTECAEPAEDGFRRRSDPEPSETLRAFRGFSGKIRTLPLLVALIAAGCAPNDPWRYQSVLYERDHQIRSQEDAEAAAGALAAKPVLTLDDCYRLAVPRSESLAIAGEELVRVQTRYEQVTAASLPYAAFKGSYNRQEDVSSGSGEGSNFTIPERTQYQFHLRQPIFAGFKEWYGRAQLGAEYGAREEALRHLRLLLYADVAEAFYAILHAEAEIDATTAALGLARERLEELSQRHRLGISRRSEVLAQEAEVSSTEARAERLKGALSVAWETLQFLTGLASRRTLNDVFTAPDPLPPADTLVARAIERRSDVKSLRDLIRAADHSRGVARAGYFPTLTLESNYYTHREGSAEDIDWDVLLSFEVPLFEGGAVQTKLRESASASRTARLQLDERLRVIRLDIHRSHADASSLRTELVSLEKALASAQENYDLVRGEYQQSIVTNIEVLASFDTLQTARLARDRARFQLKAAAVRLAVHSGALPGESP